LPVFEFKFIHLKFVALVLQTLLPDGKKKKKKKNNNPVSIIAKSTMQDLRLSQQ
jgi:hypothetical protein